jgi:hypothetical protein
MIVQRSADLGPSRLKAGELEDEEDNNFQSSSSYNLETLMMEAIATATIFLPSCKIVFLGYTWT